MPVTFDSASEGYVNNAASHTISHTVGSGSNRVLYVFSVCTNSTDFLTSGSCSYGGTSMGSPIGSAIVATSQFMYVWRMLAPPSGTANVVVTPSASAYLNTHVVSLSDVDQTTPNGTLATWANGYTNSPLSTAVTTASGGMAIDCVNRKTTGVTHTVAGSQTQNGSQVTGAFIASSASSRLADATAMGWSWSAGQGNYAQIVVPVNPAGGGGGGSSIPAIFNHYRKLRA